MNPAPPPPPPPTAREAQNRLVILLTVRALGVVAMLTGLGIWLGGADTRPGLGTVLFVFGAGLSFLAPALLARRWRSPRP